jgi:tetratricopeptide (TPR) repeat protein
MKRLLLASLIAFSLLPLPALANDPGATPSATSSPSASSATKSPVAQVLPKSITESLVEPRKLIAAKSWLAAIVSLKKVDLAFPNNADVNNLLGFTSRNLGLYADATKYYAKALKIDPNHLGALEYQGVLFIKTNKLTSAKINLSKLKKLCGTSCAEYQDLLKELGSK